ncbi:MAG: aspartate aminotransferase family protein [Bacteroidota bacterium]
MDSSKFYLQNNLAQTNPYMMGIDVSHAEGLHIYDKRGKAYLDLISGLGVSALGHGNQAVNDALKAQIDRHLHVMVYGEFRQDAQLQLANLLAENLPSSLDTSYFVNSGTEANEAALKLAKRVTGRQRIIAFRGAYHGSTHGSLSVSGNDYKKTAFQPLLPQVEFIHLNRYEELASIDFTCAAVIVETIQGDAGIRIPEQAYLEALRQQCDRVGALLIFDEVQAGMGRAGTLWAFEHYDVVPDILTLGKALGAGLPIGALISSQANMSQFTFDPMLGHITTFGGHPLICAGAYAGLKYLLSTNLIAEANEKGQLLHDLLIEHPLVTEIRFRGLYFAIEMETAEVVQRVVERCLEEGLITFWFLSCPNAFRVAPPLVITREELREAGLRMCEVFDEVLEGRC